MTTRHDHVLRAVDEQIALNAFRASSPRLRFLEDLVDAPHGDLADYFPETAAGTLRPRVNESLYAADGIHFIGRDDGSMVPVRDYYLEPMPENIWDAGKFSALVEAAESGDDLIVEPGYADLGSDHGAVTAQVRDGNHRTFAPIAAGSHYSWVMMSDRTRQDLDERAPGSAPIYRAVRQAQREFGAPLFERPRPSHVRPGKRTELLAAERHERDVDAQLAETWRELLRTYGPSTRGGYSLDEQLRRPGLFWQQRLSELSREQREAYYDSPLGERVQALHDERVGMVGRLYDLRKAAGLQHGERLDPDTGKVVRS